MRRHEQAAAAYREALSDQPPGELAWADPGGAATRLRRELSRRDPHRRDGEAPLRLQPGGAAHAAGRGTRGRRADASRSSKRADRSRKAGSGATALAKI